MATAEVTSRRAKGPRGDLGVSQVDGWMDGRPLITPPSGWDHHQSAGPGTYLSFSACPAQRLPPPGLGSNAAFRASAGFGGPFFILFSLSTLPLFPWVVRIKLDRTPPSRHVGACPIFRFSPRLFFFIKIVCRFLSLAWLGSLTVADNRFLVH